MRILSSWAVPWRCQPFSFRNSDSLIFSWGFRQDSMGWTASSPSPSPRGVSWWKLAVTHYCRPFFFGFSACGFFLVGFISFWACISLVLFSFLPCIHNIYIYLPILPYGRSFARLFLYHLILLLCKTCTSIFCSVRMDLWWLRWPWQSPAFVSALMHHLPLS